MATKKHSSTALKIVKTPALGQINLESIEYRLSEIASISHALMKDAFDIADGNLEGGCYMLKEMARRIGALAESVGEDLGVPPNVCDFSNWEREGAAEGGVA